MISSISNANGTARTEAPRGGLSTGSHLLVQAGEYVCALPLVSVRRVLRSLHVHPLPGSAPELEGLAEFGGEPLPVLNLARMVNAAPGANPAYPVTIVVWTGPPEARELMGLAADAALEVADVPPGSVVSVGGVGGGGMGGGGFLLGEAPVAGKVVRVINLEALGQER
jgi:chemotaxis signal transduction protein